VVYLIGIAIFLFGGPHDSIFLFIIVVMTGCFSIIFSKEMKIVILSVIQIILHQKKEIFFYFMYLLSGLSFILTYITLIIGLFTLAFLLFFMGIIFLLLAKIESISDLYRNLVKFLVDFFQLATQKVKIFAKKLYYLLLNEFLYRFLQVINVLILIFGFYLFISGIFDPTGGLVEDLLRIKIIAIFPDLNIIFELLFGFSLVVISFILYIITVQNKKKLTR
jgi:hypothetical protein